MIIKCWNDYLVSITSFCPFRQASELTPIFLVPSHRHLHLHNFWVLAYGNQDGSAWTPADKKSYDLRRPVSRNTFNLHTDSWTAIRVKFDNPGVAFMRKFATFAWKIPYTPCSHY